MLNDLETGAGLDVILWFTENRTPLLTPLAELLNYTGGALFYLVLMLILYWLVDREYGIRAAFALIVGGMSNAAMKVALARPRPFDVSEAVMPLVEADGFGLPSGHVMASLVFFGYIAYTLHDRRATIAAGVYVVLQMWARMYLGVHYPQDVLLGLFAGLVVLYAFIELVGPVARTWNRLTLSAQVATAILLAIMAPILVFNNDDGMALAGVLFGAVVGIILIERRGMKFEARGVQLSPQVQINWLRIGLFLVGSTLAVLILFATSPLVEPLAEEGSGGAALLRMGRYALTALFIVIGWPFIAYRKRN